MKHVRLNKRQQVQLRQLLKKVTVVPYSPTDEAIKQRVEELGRLGLTDEPEFFGISSSVKQYAIAALTAEAGYYDPLPMPFVTEHAGLLNQSVFLTLRYGMQPMHPEVLAKQLDAEKERKAAEGG